MLVDAKQGLHTTSKPSQPILHTAQLSTSNHTHLSPRLKPRGNVVVVQHGAAKGPAPEERQTQALNLHHRRPVLCAVVPVLLLHASRVVCVLRCAPLQIAPRLYLSGPSVRVQLCHTCVYTYTHTRTHTRAHTHTCSCTGAGMISHSEACKHRFSINLNED